MDISPTQEKYIVLVEDNEDDELLTIRSFKKNNIELPITVLRDGEDAIEFFTGSNNFEARGFDQLPELIILDLKIPKRSGLEVLETLRKADVSRSIPIIVLTSSLEDRDLAFCYENGVNAYVQKPIRFAEFSDAIKTLGQFWLTFNRTPRRQLLPSS